RELAPINNNNIPNSAEARLQRSISEEEIAGLKQTFEMIDADIGLITRFDAGYSGDYKFLFDHY
ncbi:hypothetical protein Tco_0958992, partial [Tanacetum coccineum]